MWSTLIHSVQYVVHSDSQCTIRGPLWFIVYNTWSTLIHSVQYVVHSLIPSSDSKELAFPYFHLVKQDEEIKMKKIKFVFKCPIDFIQISES